MKLARIWSTVLLVSTLLFLGPVSPNVWAQAKTQSKRQSAEGSLPRLCGGQHDVNIVVDVNSSSAVAQLEFCPPDKQGSVQATLTAGDFTSRMTKLGLGASVVFSRPEEKMTGSSLKLGAIQPSQVMTVKAEISNLWEAGEAEAPLRVNGVEVGKLVAVKYRLPFGIEVETPDPAKPEMILERNQIHDIVLKNKDTVSYLIEWDLQVAGTPFHGSSAITPNGSIRFTVNPDRKWYCWLTGLLKDNDQDGKLTLSFRPPGVERPSFWPSKVISVKVHLRYSSETARAWVVNILLLLVLVAGAVTSFLGSVGLPNRLKRSEFREELGRLGQRISGISHQVDSRLRVVARVQRKRLSVLLESPTSISADLNRVFDQVSQGMASLQKQVRVAEQIDVAHHRLKLLDVKRAAPSLLTAAEESVWKAAELISYMAPTDQELEQSQRYLDDASAFTDKASAFDATFAQGLPARSAQLQADLKIFADTAVYKKIQAALPGIFADFIVSAAPATLEQSSRLDCGLAKAELIRQFLQIYHVTENPQIHTQLDKQLERLLAALSLESWDAIRRGRLLVRELQEGVYPDDLVQAGHAGAAQIEIDPSAPVVNDLIRFNVRFNDPRLNTAAARLEFEGRWSFGHDDYYEIAWDPFHYFPRSGSLPVTFSFQSAGDKEAILLSRTLTVSGIRQRWYERDRNRAEIGRFALALLPAMFGLLAGAREQLLKMDVSSALFAVFLLGFGSDSVKNLVSQSQQASPVPTAKAAAGPAPAPPAGMQPKSSGGKSS